MIKLNYMFVMLALLFSCGNSSVDLSENKTKRKENVLSNQELGFKKFTRKFHEITLPYEFCQNCHGMFNDYGEISLDEIESFLHDCESVDDLTGHQFYFRERFHLSSGLMGLVYYKTSDMVFEHKLVVFDEEGNFLDKLVIASVHGEFDTERETSSFINIKGDVVKNDIALSNMESLELTNRKALKKTYEYRINSDGKISTLSEAELKEIRVYLDEHGNIKEENP